MKFDETRVYSICNADEVKIGSKGFFADNISDLKKKVNEGHEPLFLTKIYGEEAAARFSISPVSSYILFYLVEEPKEKKYRPYHDTAEIPDGALLKIAVSSDNTRLLITAVHDRMVYLGPHGWVDLNDLYKYYTWLNGTPCGVEEQENEEN